jgi:hypothetical protein
MQHLNSKSHLDKEQVKSSNKSIKNFFRKLSRSPTRKDASSHQAQLPTAGPLRTLSGDTPSITSPPGFSIAQHALFETPIAPPTQDPVLPVDALALISQIRHQAEFLPNSVPEATALDALAIFVSNVTLDITGQDGPWEVVNKILHLALGYNSSVEELSKLIRRGPYSVLAFTCWIEACIRDVGIDGVLLEDRLARMLQAVKAL